MPSLEFYTREGVPMIATQATVEREYVLNGVSRATFSLAYSDTACKEHYLRFGNIVRITHEKLPAWVGMIEPDEGGGYGWGGGKVTVQALSAGYAFQYADSNIVKISGTAGAMFEQMIEMLNAQDVVVKLRAGEIYLGGTSRQETLGMALIEHVRRISARSGNDWSVTGELENGRLILYANWYETRGTRQAAMLVDENLEYSSDLVREVGTIENDIRGFGDATNGGTRLETERQADADSIAFYGRRRTSKVFSGNIEMSTLVANARSYMKNKSYPRRRFNVSVADVDDLFRKLDLGNSYRYKTKEAGFGPNGGIGMTGIARIIGMKYRDDLERVTLALLV